MFQELIKVFVRGNDGCNPVLACPNNNELQTLCQPLSPQAFGLQRGQPITISPQPDAEPEDVILSDLDKALKQKERSVCMDQDVLHNSCVQILAEE